MYDRFQTIRSINGVINTLRFFRLIIQMDIDCAHVIGYGLSGDNRYDIGASIILNS